MNPAEDVKAKEGDPARAGGDATDASGGGANPGVSEAVNSDLAALAESLKDKEKPKEDDSDDDEAEIVEESPCGRWLKRREEVIF